MKRIVTIVCLVFFSLYVLLCGIMYLEQESIIFIPQKLAKNLQFEFNGNYQEINLKATDGKTLNGLLFKADSSKGLIFYLHGNAGNLNSWGNIAEVYTKLHYDILIIDYRGFGKSEGEIVNESQLFEDNQLFYNEMAKLYGEDNMVIMGYSIGTGLAAQLASVHHPKLLVLQAPYYSLKDIMQKSFPIVPTFLLKYPFETNLYLHKCNMPVVIFHGDKDEVIYYGSSLKLQNE